MNRTDSLFTKKWHRNVFVASIAAFVISMIMVLPCVQNFLLGFLEDRVVRRSLTREYWISAFNSSAVRLLVFSLLTALSCFFYFPDGSSLSSLGKIDFLSSKLRSEKYIVWGVVGIYVIINAVSIIFHEHFCDEGHAWTIAERYNPVTIFRVTPEEGHPMLWFLVLMPFAKLHVPFEIFSWISFSIVFVSVILLVRKFNANLLIKTALLFSPVFCYFSTVVARNYCLYTLELVCLVIFYGDRNKKPLLWGLLIAAMLQTHIYLSGLCGMLLLQMLFEFFTEKEKNKKILIFAGGIIGALSVLLLLKELGGGDADSFEKLMTIKQHPVATFISSCRFIFEQIAFNIGGSIAFIFCGILAFLVIHGVRNFNNCWQEIFILAGTVVCLVGIAFVHRGGHFSHSVAIFSLILADFYILYSKIQLPDFKKAVNACILFMLIISWPVTFGFVKTDIAMEFSHSKKFADFVNKNYRNAAIYCETEYIPVLPCFKYGNHIETDENTEHQLVLLFQEQAETDTLKLVFKHEDKTMIGWEPKLYLYEIR